MNALQCNRDFLLFQFGNESIVIPSRLPLELTHSPGSRVRIVHVSHARQGKVRSDGALDQRSGEVH